ncbi:MarR family transcriptional regulator [Rhodococcus sp. NPDC047139]|uniref:MarR family winged helix-turn-helix transcriptional regulator n=1 Tax=Rhodococcus sp. NPDC047139 TaxID=3155141 RepID=UPI0033CA338A
MTEKNDTEVELLSAAAVTAFRLNGQFLALAETLARPVGLTATWWQVLGALSPDPLPVSAIAREMGITRQSVQRVADLLVARGLAEYRPNPAHRRAKLVAMTSAGREAIRAIAPAHAVAARGLREETGLEELGAVVEGMRALSAALDRLAERCPAPDEARGARPAVSSPPGDAVGNDG